MKHLRILALLAALSTPALARPPMETNQLVDDAGTPIGTSANPLFVSGGGGGGGGGTVTQGTSPWVISGNATANGSGNPIFTQVTNFPATQTVAGSVTLNASNNVVGGTFASVTIFGGGVSSTSRIPSSAASTNLTQAKGVTGRVYKIIACNTTTTAARIKFYDALSASVTVGSTAPKLTRPIPAAATAGGLACSSYDWADLGASFGTAISYALTTGAADSDATAVAAGAITDVSVEFQ